MKNKFIIVVSSCALVLTVMFSFFLKDAESRRSKFDSNKDKENSIPEHLSRHRSVTQESGSERKISDKENVEFRPVTALSMLEFSRIGLKKIEGIKKSLSSGSGWVISNPPENVKSHKTLTEAFERMYSTVSMHDIPTKYTEDEGFFYFSGGDTSHKTLDFSSDFSSGIAVSKKDGSMASWQIAPLE